MNNEHTKKQFKYWTFVAVQDCGSWANKTFPLSSPQSIIAHFREEAKELDIAVDVNTDSSESLKEIAEEAADVCLLLFHLCYKLRIDLGLAIVEKFEKNKKKRNWETKPNSEGYFKHTEK